MMKIQKIVQIPILISQRKSFLHHLSRQNRTNPKKKPSKKRQRTGEEANKVHTQMCGKAVKLMSKLERILNKFDSDSIDDD